MKTTNAQHTPDYPQPSEVIAMNNEQLDEFCREHIRLKARLSEWEERFEMGPAWVSASLTEQAHERQWLDKYEAALIAIRNGLSDDRAYRDCARKALEGKS